MKSRLFSILIPLAVIILSLEWLSATIQVAEVSVDNRAIPPRPIHWHPTLTVHINDAQYEIPAGLGIDRGRNIDNEISGGAFAPIHTHDASGVLHMEQVAPSRETMTLGYFIDSVWGVRFNSECIIEWCNDDVRAVKIFVNGRRSYEYERYVMHDEDDITIVYEETLNERTTSDFQIF